GWPQRRRQSAGPSSLPPRPPRRKRSSACGAPSSGFASRHTTGTRMERFHVRPELTTNGGAASSQLERGDAEHALETDVADRSGIHPRGLEDRPQALVVSERDRIPMNAGAIEKDSARPCRRDQRREGGLGGGAVVGHQRADPAAAPAWTDHAPRGKAAVAHERAADMPTRAAPRAQERRARRRN